MKPTGRFLSRRLLRCTRLNMRLPGAHVAPSSAPHIVGGGLATPPAPIPGDATSPGTAFSFVILAIRQGIYFADSSLSLTSLCTSLNTLAPMNFARSYTKVLLESHSRPSSTTLVHITSTAPFLLLRQSLCTSLNTLLTEFLMTSSINSRLGLLAQMYLATPAIIHTSISFKLATYLESTSFHMNVAIQPQFAVHQHIVTQLHLGSARSFALF